MRLQIGTKGAAYKMQRVTRIRALAVDARSRQKVFCPCSLRDETLAPSFAAEMEKNGNRLGARKRYCRGFVKRERCCAGKYLAVADSAQKKLSG